MEWKKIVAIVRRDKLRDVEECLKDLRVNGISVTRGKGYADERLYSAKASGRNRVVC